MLYLLIILLLFGLSQSLLELKKEDKKVIKWKVKKILSVLYIGGFIIAVFVTVIQENATAEISRLLEGISASITKIDTMEKRLSAVHSVQDSLLTQYYRVNSKLSKQVELDEKNLEEKTPVIGLMDYDIKWQGNDSTSYYLEACIRNFGKRNAQILDGRGYVVFFDHNNIPFHSLDIPGNSNKSILEANESENMRLCYFSHGILSFQHVKANIAFAIIFLKIKYKDILMDKVKEENFYSSWNPKMDDFGGPRNWQIGLAQKWAKERNK